MILFSLKRSLLRVAFWIIVTQASVAQDRIFDHYTIDDGLNHSTIYQLMQDRAGFLWIGTEDGLQCFDGDEFLLFKHRPFDSTSLRNNNINSIIEADSIHLWIGTWGGGLHRFNRTTRASEFFRHRPSDATSLSDDRIQVLFKDSRETLWVGTVSGGLQRYDPNTKSFQKTKLTLSNTDERIWAIDGDRENLWIGTDKGVSRMNLSTGQVADIPFFDQRAIRALKIDHTGALWVGLKDGVVVGHPERADWNYVSRVKRLVNRIFEDSHGDIWIGTLFDGLFQIRRTDGVEIQYRNVPGNSHSLVYNDVRAIMEDSRKNLWIGTRGGGISKTDLKPLRFNVVPIASNMASRRVMTLWADRFVSGTMWIGTDANLLMVKNGATSVIPLDGKTDIGIRTITQSRDGRIWVGTFTDGIHILDKQGRWLEKRINVHGDSTSLPSNAVRMLMADPDGESVWIGTERGLCRWRGQGGAIDHFGIKDEIRAIVTLKNGSMWIGLKQGGLLRRDPGTGTVTVFRHDPLDVHSLSSNEVLCIVPEPGDSALWIGTLGGGLNRLDLASHKFQHWWHDDGLPSDFVNSAIFDERGVLWLGTNNGLAEMVQNNLSKAFRVYDTRDGIPNRLFNAAATFADAKGNLYFGTVDGAVMFNPAKIELNELAPPVELVRYRLFQGSSVIDHSLFELHRITLEADDQYVSFRFAALDFTQPKRNNFAYRLEGFDQAWIDAGDRRATSYANLNPGEYVFRVKAANRDGIWNETGASIIVTVLPPWWRTWWALSFYGLCVLGLFYGVRQFEINRERQKAQVNESELRALTAEALNDQKNEYVGIVAHDLRNPLSAIIGYTELVMDDLKKDNIEKAELLKDLQTVDKVAKNMSFFIAELLDIASIESGKVRVEKTSVSIAMIVNGIIPLHFRRAEQKNIRLTAERLDTLPNVLVDHLKIASVIDNLVGNALKYTRSGGTVRINGETVGSEVYIHVEDTGQGLTPDDLSKVFTTFTKLSARPTGNESSNGLGLAIVKKIVEIHNGRVWVKSEHGKGSTFSFSLPI